MNKKLKKGSVVTIRNNKYVVITLEKDKCDGCHIKDVCKQDSPVVVLDLSSFDRGGSKYACASRSLDKIDKIESDPNTLAEIVVSISDPTSRRELKELLKEVTDG